MPAKTKKRAQHDNVDVSGIALSERLTLSIEEFSALVGVSRSTTYKAIAAGDLVPCHYGRRVFITQEEMRRFVKNMPGNGSASR